MAVGESVLPRSGGLTWQHWERVAPALSSVLLHGLLLIALVLAPAIEARPPPPEETAVDVVSPGQFDEMLRGAKSADRSAEKPAEKAPARPPADTVDLPASASPALNLAPGGEMRIWRKAAQILSDAALADPRHRKLAARLRMLETNTRLEQLCSLEAILHRLCDAGDPERRRIHHRRRRRLSQRRPMVQSGVQMPDIGAPAEGLRFRIRHRRRDPRTRLGVP